MRFCDIKFFDPHDLSLSTSTTARSRLHFARTARALTGRYMCERGVLSEFRAARSPNQVLTHAARAAATQLNFSHSVAARGAREGPWSGQAARARGSYWFDKHHVETGGEI